MYVTYLRCDSLRHRYSFSVRGLKATRKGRKGELSKFAKPFTVYLDKNFALVASDLCGLCVKLHSSSVFPTHSFNLANDECIGNCAE